MSALRRWLKRRADALHVSDDRHASCRKGYISAPMDVRMVLMWKPPQNACLCVYSGDCGGQNQHAGGRNRRLRRKKRILLL